MSIQGKSPAVFRLANGRTKSSYGLGTSLRHIGGFHQHQVVQHSVDGVVLRIVPAASWSQDKEAKIRRCVQEFFEAPVRIEVEIKNHLELPASGKFQAMVCAC